MRPRRPKKGESREAYAAYRKEAEKRWLSRGSRRPKRQLTLPPPLPNTSPTVRTKKEEEEIRAQRIKMYEEAKKRQMDMHRYTPKYNEKLKDAREKFNSNLLKKRNPPIKSKQKVKDIGARTYKVPARVGTGRRKYNQAAYLSGLGVNPAIKRNKNIYKPYANGGGVRKPKYRG